MRTKVKSILCYDFWYSLIAVCFYKPWGNRRTYWWGGVVNAVIWLVKRCHMSKQIYDFSPPARTSIYSSSRTITWTAGNRVVRSVSRWAAWVRTHIAYWYIGVFCMDIDGYLASWAQPCHRAKAREQWFRKIKRNLAKFSKSTFITALANATGGNHSPFYRGQSPWEEGSEAPRLHWRGGEASCSMESWKTCPEKWFQR